ncbi:TRAP transporter small permease [Caminibacter pacificus]|jgi:C4-dicarboxylate transporter DctQ subunit
MKLIDLFDKIVRGILIFLTSFGIAGGILLAFINVVARFVFHEGIDWAFELTNYLFIWSAFFGAAYLFRIGGHIKVTLILDLLPDKLAKLDVLLVDLIIIAYLATVGYFGYLFIFDPDLGVYSSGEVSVDLGIPMWIPYIVIPLSSLFGILMVIFKMKEDITTPAEEIRGKSESEMIIEEVRENMGEVK